MDYLGIGRLNMFLYVVVFIIAVGITITLFTPNSLQTSLSDTSGLTDTKTSPSGRNIFGFFGFIWNMIVTFFTFVGRALTFDIPMCPVVIRFIIGFPMVVLFFTLIIDYAIEFFKVVSQFIDSIVPF
jgi:hypothetical protein